MAEVTVKRGGCKRHKEGDYNDRVRGNYQAPAAITARVIKWKEGRVLEDVVMSRWVSDATVTEKIQTEGNNGREKVRDQEEHRTRPVRRLEVPGVRGDRGGVPKFTKRN